MRENPNALCMFFMTRFIIPIFIDSAKEQYVFMMIMNEY